MARRSDKRSIQQPISIPREYVPISFPSGDERYRGRSSTHSYQSASSANPYIPSSKSHDYGRHSQQPQGPTTANPYIPSSNGYDDRHSSRRSDDRYRRSSSQPPTNASPYNPNSNYHSSSKNYEYDGRYSSGSPSGLDDRQHPRGSTSASPYTPRSDYHSSSKNDGYDGRRYYSGSPSRVDDRYRRSTSQQPRGSTGLSASHYPSSKYDHSSGSPSGLDHRYRRSSSQQPTSASPYVPRSDYYPSSKSHGHDYSSGPPSRLDHRHRRSSSQQPRGSDRYRPTYSRQRSNSYDVSRSAGGRTTNHDGISQVPRAASKTIHASETLPTFVHPSHKQPLIVPISNGRNGWVIVPTNGKEVRVMDPLGSQTIHPLAKPLSSGKQGSRFFGGFGFGSKHHSKTRSGKPEYSHAINPFRRRRDSY